MLGFEPRISGVGSDRSSNWVTNTAPPNFASPKVANSTVRLTFRTRDAAAWQGVEALRGLLQEGRQHPGQRHRQVDVDASHGQGQEVAVLASRPASRGPRHPVLCSCSPARHQLLQEPVGRQTGQAGRGGCPRTAQGRLHHRVRGCRPLVRISRLWEPLLGHHVRDLPVPDPLLLRAEAGNVRWGFLQADWLPLLPWRPSWRSGPFFLIVHPSKYLFLFNWVRYRNPRPRFTDPRDFTAAIFLSSLIASLELSLWSKTCLILLTSSRKNSFFNLQSCLNELDFERKLWNFSISLNLVTPMDGGGALVSPWYDFRAQCLGWVTLWCIKESFSNQVSFEGRIGGISRLYSAIMVSTLPKESLKSKRDHPHGLGHAWKLLASSLNLRPDNGVVTTILVNILEVCGHALFERLLLLP